MSLLIFGDNNKIVTSTLVTVSFVTIIWNVTKNKLYCNK